MAAILVFSTLLNLVLQGAANPTPIALGYQDLQYFYSAIFECTQYVKLSLELLVDILQFAFGISHSLSHWIFTLDFYFVHCQSHKSAGAHDFWAVASSAWGKT
tara:strand:+ start:131 stop:439 length:309 start_codon:yes stop_codon:yes gene_type:complete